MFTAWLDRVLTPCPRHLRVMGYLRELTNIQARRDRCWWAWQPHLERSRAVIRAALAMCSRRRKAFILGSGLHNDIPLAELAGAFQEVVLVDILHPLSSRWRCRRFRNVRTLAADVTGTVEAVYRAAADAKQPLPNVFPEMFCDDASIDLVASVNLLSQLSEMPAAYLKRGGHHSDQAIANYSRHLVEAHLDFLHRLPGTVALITDVECQTLDRSGRVVHREDLLHGVPFPYTGERWDWNLAPRLEVNADFSYRHVVVGIPNLKQAQRASTAGCLE